MNLYTSLIIVLLLVACNFTPNGTETSALETSGGGDKDTIEKSFFQKSVADSIILKKAKEDTLFELVERFRGTDLDFEVTTKADSPYETKSVVKVRKFFDDTDYYAIIYTDIMGLNAIDVYQLKESNIVHKVTSEWGLAFSSDTIFDVNGDGTKDFLVNYYPLSGCCRRNCYAIYLSPATTNKLITEAIDLVNPTFSPEEKMVRGVEYGHPGEVGLYKYRWKGEKLDTVEYIYPDKTTKGKTFIKTTKEAYLPDRSEGLPIKALPKEYEMVEELDWFLLYGEGVFDER